jgi:photosystem II stability/assembly factor-like uncharacterized protein
VPFAAISFISPDEGWAVVLSGADRAIETIHTMDGGATWGRPVKVAQLDVPAGYGPPQATIHFASSLVGWVSVDGIWATTDGGNSWTDSGVHGTDADIASVGESVWAMTGCDPRNRSCPTALYAWDAAALRWKLAAHQPPASSGPLQLIRISAQRAFVVQQPEMDTRLIRTDDGGTTWTTLAIPCRGFAGMPVATRDGVHIWLVCPSQPGAGSQAKSVFTSGDGGSTWTLRAQTDPPGLAGQITISGYAKLIALASNSSGFLAMDRGDLYRSTDGGATWSAVGIAQGEGFFSSMQFVDSTHGWVAGETAGVDCCMGLYRTVDGGLKWTVVSSFPGRI